MVQEVPIVPLNILNQSKHGSNHDKYARRIEYLHVFLPRNMWRTRSREGIFMDLQVKVRRSDHKECKEEYLDHETNDDDVLAILHAGQASTSLNAATWTGSETYLVIWGCLMRYVPAPCNKNERTSPVTNILVNHFFFKRACDSACNTRIIRPSSMYMEAARRAGASKRKSVCTM